MTAVPWTLRALRRALANGATCPSELAEAALARSNGNASRNTYLWQDAVWTRAEAARAEAMPRSSGGPFGDGRPALWGLPISVKDCFDLAGSPTTCGVRFYRDLNGMATRDSWLVEQLRATGAVIVGKTHLHPLAYGITGENPEFGDCVQPRDSGALTGGSSSGAVASVQEGSAVAAIGTDTGGSVRAPAALGGLAGYRATIGRGDWRGAAHLAVSFDTMGWLFRDLEDAPLLAATFATRENVATVSFTRFAFLGDKFLYDCEPEVIESFRRVIGELQALGLDAEPIDLEGGLEWWMDSIEIFAPLQAAEAALVHAGHFDRCEPAIRDRLKWGASLTPDEVASLRQRHADYRARMDELFAAHQLVLLPCAPVARLAAGADHSQTRSRLLRYTSPFSLAGVPAVAIPCAHGGMQLAASREFDEQLLALAAQIGAQRNAVSEA
ncbi:MAG: amidase [Terracidiphilus sp.]|jgi:aspartyl-tRNA(Asn)/glutamyl-tRNA(Gln) amidotransferase subunit A